MNLFSEDQMSFWGQLMKFLGKCNRHLHLPEVNLQYYLTVTFAMRAIGGWGQCNSRSNVILRSNQETFRRHEPRSSEVISMSPKVKCYFEGIFSGSNDVFFMTWIRRYKKEKLAFQNFRWFQFYFSSFFWGGGGWIRGTPKMKMRNYTHNDRF